MTATPAENPEPTIANITGDQPSDAMTPTGLTRDQQVGHYIDMWKLSVEVQMHFNDIEWRIRGLALTVATFALGSRWGRRQGRHPRRGGIARLTGHRDRAAALVRLLLRRPGLVPPPTQGFRSPRHRDRRRDQEVAATGRDDCHHHRTQRAPDPRPGSATQPKVGHAFRRQTRLVLQDRSGRARTGRHRPPGRSTHRCCIHQGTYFTRAESAVLLDLVAPVRTIGMREDVPGSAVSLARTAEVRVALIASSRLAAVSRAFIRSSPLRPGATRTSK